MAEVAASERASVKLLDVAKSGEPVAKQAERLEAQDPKQHVA